MESAGPYMAEISRCGFLRGLANPDVGRLVEKMTSVQKVVFTSGKRETREGTGAVP